MNQAIKAIRTARPWHTGLTGKLTWTQIGALSQKTAQRGALADARRANSEMYAAIDQAFKAIES